MTIPVKLLLIALGFGFPAAVVLQYVAGARTVHGFKCIGILQVTWVNVYMLYVCVIYGVVRVVLVLN